MLEVERFRVGRLTTDIAEMCAPRSAFERRGLQVPYCQGVPSKIPLGKRIKQRHATPVRHVRLSAPETNDSCVSYPESIFLPASRGGYSGFFGSG